LRLLYSLQEGSDSDSDDNDDDDDDGTMGPYANSGGGRGLEADAGTILKSRETPVVR
jgi:hypothetical protein